jgi:succinate dehydrogenase / fumarate reductase membrane anchor subunit
MVCCNFVGRSDHGFLDNDYGDFVMNLRSPLSHVLGSGSAKEGTDHFWGQRVSAVALAFLGLWFMFSLITLSSVDFELSAVADWVGRTPNSVMLVLLILTLGYHSSLGIQVILEDYVHGPMVKVVALILSKFTHIVVASGAVFAVLKLAFGGSL